MVVRLQVKFAEQNLLVADKSIDLAKGDYLPTLNGFAGLTSFESDINPNSLGKEIKDNFQYNYGSGLTPIWDKVFNTEYTLTPKQHFAKMRKQS